MLFGDLLTPDITKKHPGSQPPIIGVTIVKARNKKLNGNCYPFKSPPEGIPLLHTWYPPYARNPLKPAVFLT